MDLSKNIILTGAGFSANFGGFLAREMWSKIFNNPKLDNAGKLKLELRNNFDFEEVYFKAIGRRIKDLPNHEPEIFSQVLNEAYQAMDSVFGNTQLDDFGIFHGDLREFVEFFSQATEGQTAAYFTLNQDLFPERAWGWQPLGPRSMLFDGSFGNLDINDLNSDSVKRLPNQDELDQFIGTMSSNFIYVKLHGSQKWVSADGMDTKIIGLNKREAIEKIPLLRWYFNLFEQALYRPNVRLLIIGYGFRDEHVNACIINAIKEHGLKLYVLTPENPEDFAYRMQFKYPKTAMANERDENKQHIWRAIEGYFPYTLRQLFPYPQVTGHTAAKVEVFNGLGIPLTR